MIVYPKRVTLTVCADCGTHEHKYNRCTKCGSKKRAKWVFIAARKADGHP